MSAGSGARPGKPECESRCRVLAWARRGAWGQPGLEGRRREACNLGSASLWAPAAPLSLLPPLWEPCEAGWLGPGQGPAQPPPTPSTSGCVPLGHPSAGSSELSLAQGPRSAPQPPANEATRPPSGAGGRITPLSLPLPNNPLLTPLASHQVLQDNVGGAVWHLASTPKHQPLPSMGVGGGGP